MTNSAGYFQDVILLFICSSCCLFFTDVGLQLVLAFCCALILSCTCYFLDTHRLRMSVILLYLACAFFLPDFFFFYPVAVYLLLREKQRVLPVAAVIFYTATSLSSEKTMPLQLFLALLFFALAAVLQTHTARYQNLLLRFHSSRDDSEERNLLLSEKNKALAEKQDSEIYTATLRERNRIAREIHDNVGHVLSRCLLMVGALRTINTQETVTPMLKQLHTSLNSAMDSIRTSVHDLRDESVNLKDAIESMLQEFTFCPVQLHFDMSLEIPKEIKYCFITVTKEALSNIIRHSRATKVQIRMQEHPALYQLCIEDNGGRDTNRPLTAFPDMPSQTGMGLSNMEERAKSLGGRLQIIQKEGFKIFITIPKKEGF